MKVWITKYALTKGIIETEGKQNSGTSYTITSGEYRNSWFHQTDVALSEEDAKKRAEEMRLKKIESLKKQIAKYEHMKFGDKTLN